MISLTPIGHVHNTRKDVEDDNWGGIISEIVIEIGEEALQGLEDFSHAEVIFYFDRVEEAKIVSGALKVATTLDSVFSEFDTRRCRASVHSSDRALPSSRRWVMSPLR